MKNLFICLSVSASLVLGLSAFKTGNIIYYKLDSSDTAKSIKVINIKDNPLTIGLIDIRTFDLYNDTLFLINAQKGYLIKINLKNGALATNSKLNLFLKLNLELV